jgi:Fic family protein
MLFQTPQLTENERAVVDRIDEMRAALRHQLTTPHEWVGLLRRVMLARAIQGSNSIEGYVVSLDDALAAVAGKEPTDPGDEAALAVAGYRDAMTYVIQLAEDPQFTYDETLIRALHYMMLRYDMTKSPGRWRPGPVYVKNERLQDIVYTGPDSLLVPGLMSEFAASLRADDGRDPVMVRAAMAHLNLVMIHPFKDGNGRMARCIQTLVLAREGIVAPPFSSIEEYLGENTEAYYAVLGDVGLSSYHPERDARPWVRFVLGAHLAQAQRLARRAQEAERRWEAIATELAKRRLNERAVGPVFNAALGVRLRNASYREAAGVSELIAGRDLKALASAGLLVAEGVKKGRSYLASPTLRAIEDSIRLPREPVEDPFAAVQQPSIWTSGAPATTTALRQLPSQSPTSARE